MSRAAPAQPRAAALDRADRGARPARRTLARVQEVWPRAAGPAVAAAARPVSERDGVLTVACEAAVWAAGARPDGSELIARLNARARRRGVRELRCRTA